MIIVDSDVWSEALRKREDSPESWHVEKLRDLIINDEVQMLGPIRQEALSGIRGAKKFDKIRNKLRAYPDGHFNEEIHEQAAKFYNLCRSKGVQGSHIDFMICAYSVTKKMKILSKDQDFKRYAKYIPIEILEELPSEEE
jgi:hypothetical protein